MIYRLCHSQSLYSRNLLHRIVSDKCIFVFKGWEEVRCTQYVYIGNVNINFNITRKLEPVWTCILCLWKPLVFSTFCKHKLCSSNVYCTYMDCLTFITKTNSCHVHIFSVCYKYLSYPIKKCYFSPQPYVVMINISTHKQLNGQTKIM